MISDISTGKPSFMTKLASNISSLPSDTPPHTVLILQTKNKQNDNEKWFIDVAGCQYGFQEVLIPFKRYFEEHACRDLNGSQPYDANETKDIHFFLTLPSMTANNLHRRKLMEQRDARLYFAAFSRALIEKDGGAAFNRHMLSGSTSDF